MGITEYGEFTTEGLSETGEIIIDTLSETGKIVILLATPRTFGYIF